jgi:predicted Rossmann fold nucleotide-binding protein DprA/Smf involved in DNA uptake
VHIINEIQTIPADAGIYNQWQKENFQTHCFSRFYAIGNTNLLRTQKLGLLCSSKCPGKFILQTHDLMASLQGKNITVVSGFHSPVERECLNILLRHSVSIIVCPARSLSGMRIPSSWKDQIENGYMLVLSPFSKNYRRQTKNLADRRNRLVTALADKLFIPYAAQNSKILELVDDIVSNENFVITFASSENSRLLKHGAMPLNTGEDIL